MCTLGFDLLDSSRTDQTRISNLTEQKKRTISLATLGLGFLTPGLSRKDKQQSAKFEGTPVKANKHWWGTRRRKVKVPAVTAPGGGDVQQAKKEGGEKAATDGGDRSVSSSINAAESNGSHRPGLYHGMSEYDTGADNQPLTADAPYGKSGKAPRWKVGSWENLKVGDFVKITNDEAVPAGVFFTSLLQTSRSSTSRYHHMLYIRGGRRCLRRD